MTARSLSEIASGCPRSYKREFELEQHRRQHLERRVEALTQERDALLFRLQRANDELQRRGTTTKLRQGLITSFLGA